MSTVNKFFTIATVLLATAFAVAHGNPPLVRPRVSDLGLTVGILPSRPLDAITDVAGVEVGSTTIIRVRTDVTAVLARTQATLIFRELEQRNKGSNDPYFGDLTIPTVFNKWRTV